MKDKLVKASDRFGIIAAVILAVIIIVQSLVFTDYMFNKHGDFHSDDEFSYGLSNGNRSDRFVSALIAEEPVPIYNEWLDGDTYWGYVTVGETERFDYANVYENQVNDVHPPLYYFVLHTICSFFPDTFSLWYAFSINLFSFAVMQVCLYLLAKKMTGSRTAGLLTCLFWGFTFGAINDIVFLRMYPLMTAFTLLSAYLHCCILKSEDFNLKKYLPWIAVLTFAAGLTQYHALVFAGTLSACFCFMLLFRKKFKKLFIYAGTMLASVGAICLFFPAIIHHATASSRGVTAVAESGASELPFDMQIRIYGLYILDDLFGIKRSLINTSVWYVYVIGGVLVIAAIAVPLCFLFRRETWFIAFAGKVKATFKKTGVAVSSLWKKRDNMLIFLIICSVIWVIFMALTTGINSMGEFSRRYLFGIYPVIILCAVCLAHYIIGLFSKLVGKTVRRIALCAVTVIFTVSAFVNGTFLFDDDTFSTVDITALVEGKPLVVSTMYFWENELFTFDMQHPSKLLITSADATEGLAEAVNTLDDGETVIIAIGETTDEDVKKSLGGANGGAAGENIIFKKSTKVYDCIKNDTKFSNVKYITTKVYYGRIMNIYEATCPDEN